MTQVLRVNETNLCHYHANFRQNGPALCVNGTILGVNDTALGVKVAFLGNYCPEMGEKMSWCGCK